MKYQWTIITIGVIVILFPMLNLPFSWEVILQITLGVVLILTGVSIQQSRTRSAKKASAYNPLQKKQSPLETGEDTQSAQGDVASTTIIREE